MATTLQSPGIQVNVIDESFYTPAAPGTVPLIFVASASGKSNASATGTAQGTLTSNAGQVYVITSQRDLTDTFGTPLFPTDGQGNPVNGGELNEYGLQAAYSLLGVSSRAYVVRADIDLGELVASSDEPTGSPVGGTYWVDTANSIFGINEWNSGTNTFSVKTPIVIDSANSATTLVVGTLTPADSTGQQGDYAVVVTPDNGNQLHFKTTAATNAWVPVSTAPGADFASTGKSLKIGPHYDYPAWEGTAAKTGSVWIKTTTPGQGANWKVKYYNATTAKWTTLDAPIYSSTRQANEKLDYAGGGVNIPVGNVFIETDYNHNSATTATTAVANFKVWRRTTASPTTITGSPSTSNTTTNTTFYIRESSPSTSTWGSSITVTVPGSGTASIAQQIPAALSAAGLKYVTGSYNATTQRLTLSHSLGGDFELRDGTGTPLNKAGFYAYNMQTGSGSANLYTAPGNDGFDFIATGWKPLSYESTPTTPVTAPADGTLWYDSNLDVDILVHNGHSWVGYNFHGDGNTTFDSPFYNTGTDPAGPIVSALEPTTQSDGTPLVDGDIWVSTADPEMYGMNIYVWSSSLNKWIAQDVTDNNSPNGWVFADARWNAAGTSATAAPIETLLTSDFLDPDAPDPALYPRGTRLWNTRRSGFNVKRYQSGLINLNSKNPRYRDQSQTGYFADRWVTASVNNEDGTGSFGRKAQRQVVVKALKSLIDTSQAVRDTDTLVFNLIACPGYPEVISNMVGLNTDRGQTAFVVGDTPFRLEPNGTALTNWGLNKNLAYDNGDDGAVSYDPYMAMFYPSGLTTDNTGNKIVVPASHMMLRTIINSDAVSYQWFAPAGTRRGGVDNATSVGYVDAGTGEFKTTALYQGLRDVLQGSGIAINPITSLPGVGIVNMGQKTRARNSSALDRINVARLVAYLRRQLSILAKPFLFEPNDAQTRRELKGAADSLLLELVGQRALNDFITVCDTTNNTPARIDRNELWLDVAIEPVKAVEFIYIPLRILNTGAIASGNLGSLSTGSGA